MTDRIGLRFLYSAVALVLLSGPVSSAPDIPRGRASIRATPPASPEVFVRAIQRFDGRVLNPYQFPETLGGFQEFLTASGVLRVTAEDLTRPNHPEVAARHGFREFLPPRHWWPRGAALALLTERLSLAAGEPVHIRNWWRPAAYNADPAVGGARNGDHPTANALDLDYPSESGRMRAEKWLRSLDRNSGWLGLSLGLGEKTTHVGIGSPKGRREWHYAGWRPAR